MFGHESPPGEAFVVLRAIEELDKKINKIHGQLHLLINLQLKETKRMSQDLSAIQAAVDKETAVTTSAIALINGIAAKLVDAAAEIAAAGADPAVVAKLAADLSAQADSLAAAVAANTPAAPVVAAPTPVPEAPVAEAAPAVEAPVAEAAPADAPVADAPVADVPAAS